MSSKPRHMMLVEYYAVLGNDATYRIALLLSRYALSVLEIADALKLSQSHVSHKLARLREHNYVSFHRQGKRVFYRFTEPWRSILLHSDIMWRRLNPEYKWECQADVERLGKLVGEELPDREIHPIISGPPPIASIEVR
jgi:DNA-binding transcriptional ArsR family regulator